MNTKIIMTLSAVTLGAAGILLTFMPDAVLGQLTIDINKPTLYLVQILGALYFAFGLLNWMSKTSLIGGIYNRPIVVANLTHFLIAGLALSKGLISNPESSYIIWIVGLTYVVFAVWFGLLMFSKPKTETIIEEE